MTVGPAPGILELEVSVLDGVEGAGTDDSEDQDVLGTELDGLDPAGVVPDEGETDD